MTLLDRDAVDARLRVLEDDLRNVPEGLAGTFRGFEVATAVIADNAADRRYVFREALAILDRLAEDAPPEDVPAG